MKFPAFETSQKQSEWPILIVDEEGTIGSSLVKELRKEALIVFVSKEKVDEENVIHVPFLKKIPEIPDNSYSHIFLIDEKASISSNFISPFLQKASRDNSNLILVVGREYVNSEFIYKFSAQYEKARVVVTGEIFAANFLFDTKSNINNFIKEATEAGRIEVPGNGMEEISPVFFDDVIIGILQVGFVDKGSDKIFLLFPKVKFTLLSVAHMFQKIDPDIKIDFKKSEPKIKYEEIGGNYLLGESYDLFSKVKKIKIDGQNKKTDLVVKKEINNKNNLAPFLSSIILTILFFFILPLVFTAVFALAGGFFLNNVKTDILSSDLKSAGASALIAEKSFNISKNSLVLLQKEAQFVNLQGVLFDFSKKIDQGAEISTTALSVLDSYDKLKKIINGDSKNAKSDFQSAQNNLKLSLVSYQKEVNSNVVPDNVLQKIKSVVDFTSTTIDLWPDILGFNGKKTYLVIFQNSMELRPGGGFIGSFALLTLENARIEQFKIYDVYDADGQLKNHVEPPYPIRRYLPSINWYLRDSNFDVDFSKSAVSAAVFLNSEMHQSVDGVVGVDLFFVKNLIEQIGPVKVSDYNVTVSSDNLFQVTEAKAQDNFFPGSTQKKNFLKSLFNSISSKISSQKEISYFALMESFLQSLNQKHIIFAFNNVSLQSVFSVNGWGSTLFDDRSKDKNNINDFLGINEANLGANKVNYFISRSISQTVSLQTNNLLKNTLDINFKNSADKSLGAQGLYKNYLRIILPKGTDINSVQIDGSNQKILNAVKDPALYEAKNFIPPAGLEVEKYDEGNNSIFGFLILVNPGQLKKITINYTLPFIIDSKSTQINYSQKFFKQPGIENVPFYFNFIKPKGFSFLNKPVNSIESSERLSFSTNLLSDFNFVFSLVKQ